MVDGSLLVLYRPRASARAGDLHDVFGRGYLQCIGAMEVVWPITAVYFGPLALWAYYRWGRPQSRERQEEHGDTPEQSLAVAVAETIPGGAASFLGHLEAPSIDE